MPTTKPSQQPTELEKHQRETLNAFIGKQVMHTLGTPANLYQVQVRRLWEDYYRVNVLTGEDAVSTTFANSFFVVADSEGNIIRSSPSIMKRY